jgi:hypothetical protein
MVAVRKPRVAGHTRRSAPVGPAGAGDHAFSAQHVAAGGDWRPLRVTPDACRPAGAAMVLAAVAEALGAAGGAR